MKRMILFFEFIFVLLLILVIFSNIIQNNKSKIIADLEKKNIKNINNLMVVAHPDDESLWGGINILNDDYLVVCVTCVDQERINEFKKVMEKTNDEYLILGYPDKTNGQRDDWITSYDGIKKDLIEIVNYKNWKKIVTHNPDGEYGHIHHQLLSNIMTDISSKDILYYFNKYYSEEELNNNSYDSLNDEDLLKKEEILKIYKSQKDIVNNHRSNIKYEELIKYSNWK